MEPINIHEAKTHFSRLIERVLQGEELIIARAGKPVARLVPLEPIPPKRRFGALQGKATVTDAFFEPLPTDELDAWEGQ